MIRTAECTVWVPGESSICETHLRIYLERIRAFRNRQLADTSVATIGCYLKQTKRRGGDYSASMRSIGDTSLPDGWKFHLSPGSLSDHSFVQASLVWVHLSLLESAIRQKSHSWESSRVKTTPDQKVFHSSFWVQLIYFILLFFVVVERISDLMFGSIEGDTASTEENSEYDQLSVSNTHIFSLINHDLSCILHLISQYLCLLCRVSLIYVEFIFSICL